MHARAADSGVRLAELMAAPSIATDLGMGQPLETALSSRVGCQTASWPATGKPVDVGVMVIARFDEAGKWVEDWASWDQLGMMHQLGVIPALAAA